MKTLTEKMEEAMREAIDRLPEHRTAGEKEWCEALAEAAEGIYSCAEMRLSELDDEF